MNQVLEQINYTEELNMLAELIKLNRVGESTLLLLDLFLCMCFCLWECIHHVRDACRGQKMISEALDLGTHVALRYLKPNLGSQLESSTKTASAHWSISLSMAILFKEQNLVHGVYLFDTFLKKSLKDSSFKLLGAGPRSYHIEYIVLQHFNRG